MPRRGRGKAAAQREPEAEAAHREAEAEALEPEAEAALAAQAGGGEEALDLPPPPPGDVEEVRASASDYGGSYAGELHHSAMDWSSEEAILERVASALSPAVMAALLVAPAIALDGGPLTWSSIMALPGQLRRRAVEETVELLDGASTDHPATCARLGLAWRPSPRQLTPAAAGALVKGTQLCLALVACNGAYGMALCLEPLGPPAAGASAAACELHAAAASEHQLVSLRATGTVEDVFLLAAPSIALLHGRLARLVSPRLELGPDGQLRLAHEGGGPAAGAGTELSAAAPLEPGAALALTRQHRSVSAEREGSAASTATARPGAVRLPEGSKALTTSMHAAWQKDARLVTHPIYEGAGRRAEGQALDFTGLAAELAGLPPAITALNLFASPPGTLTIGSGDTLLPIYGARAPDWEGRAQRLAAHAAAAAATAGKRLMVMDVPRGREARCISGHPSLWPVAMPAPFLMSLPPGMPAELQPGFLPGASTVDALRHWRSAFTGLVSMGVVVDVASIFGEGSASAQAEPGGGDRLPRGALTIAATLRTALDLSWGQARVHPCVAAAYHVTLAVVDSWMPLFEELLEKGQAPGAWSSAQSAMTAQLLDAQYGSLAIGPHRGASALGWELRPAHRWPEGCGPATALPRPTEAPVASPAASTPSASRLSAGGWSSGAVLVNGRLTERRVHPGVPGGYTAGMVDEVTRVSAEHAVAPGAASMANGSCSLSELFPTWRPSAGECGVHGRLHMRSECPLVTQRQQAQQQGARGARSGGSGGGGGYSGGQSRARDRYGGGPQGSSREQDWRRGDQRDGRDPRDQRDRDRDARFRDMRDRDARDRDARDEHARDQERQREHERGARQRSRSRERGGAGQGGNK